VANRGKSKPGIISASQISMKRSKPSFLLILIAWFLLLSGASVRAANPTEDLVQSKPGQNGENKQADTPATNAATKTDNPESQTAKTATNDESKDTKNEPSRLEVWSLVAQYLIFLATVLYASIALWQLWAIRRQADISERSLTELQRAWLDVEIEDVQLIQDQPTTIRVLIRNTGRSPAFVKEIKAEKPNIDRFLPTPNIKVKPTGQMSTLFIVAAGQRTGHEPPVIPPLPPDIFDELKTKMKFLTIYGWVFYDDIFDKRHVTRFYRSYKFPSHARSEGLFVIPSESKPEYNDAD
jgi:hypothetical protein